MNQIEKLQATVAAQAKALREVQGVLESLKCTHKVSVEVVADWNVLETLCRVNGITVAQAQQVRARTPAVVEAKHRIFRVMKCDYGWSVPRISRVMLCREQTIKNALKEGV